MALLSVVMSKAVFNVNVLFQKWARVTRGLVGAKYR